MFKIIQPYILMFEEEAVHVIVWYVNHTAWFVEKTMFLLHR